MRLTYTIRLTDLFWMWLTSWFTPATVAFGLFFISVLFVPGDYPRALDVAAGIFLILAAFTVAPLFWIRVTGTGALVGLPVVLTLDAAGVEGWPIVIAGGRPWDRLHRPRIESRVVVLPFRHGTSALGWVVIPRSALTEGQLATLVELLRVRGALRRGDGRSLLGRLPLTVPGPPGRHRGRRAGLRRGQPGGSQPSCKPFSASSQEAVAGSGCSLLPHGRRRARGSD